MNPNCGDWDCGWCYHEKPSETTAVAGACLHPLKCKFNKVKPVKPNVILSNMTDSELVNYVEQSPGATELETELAGRIDKLLAHPIDATDASGMELFNNLQKQINSLDLQVKKLQEQRLI